MKTKSDTVRELVAEGKYKEALAIVHNFKLGFTKEQKLTLKRAQESAWNPAFYQKLGFNSEDLMTQASTILKTIYG